MENNRRVDILADKLQNSKGNSFLASIFKKAIIKLVAHYLMNEKNKKDLPINDVCRFHLGNGAIIEDIVINANVSEVGFNRSFGVMVNYLYELKNIEKNHEDYVNNKNIIISDKLKKLI